MRSFTKRGFGQDSFLVEPNSMSKKRIDGSESSKILNKESEEKAKSYAYILRSSHEEK